MDTKEYTDLLRKAVAAHGYEVGMDSPECLSHRSNHENCEGCQYVLGCKKLVGLQLLGLSNPRPNSVETILNAKTTEEINAVLNDYEGWQEDYPLEEE